jgi:hypothetical protein
MRVLRPGNFHKIAVNLCDSCEAIVSAREEECVKVHLESGIRYILMCPECGTQSMLKEDRFKYPGHPNVTPGDLVDVQM